MKQDAEPVKLSTFVDGLFQVVYALKSEFRLARISGRPESVTGDNDRWVPKHFYSAIIIANCKLNKQQIGQVKTVSESPFAFSGLYRWRGVS